MTRSRVVITGMGWVTPLGESIDGTWRRMLAGESAIGPIRSFDARTLPTSFGAHTPADFDGLRYVADRRRHEGIADNAAKALAAAVIAWKAAGLDRAARLDPDRVGLYVACGEGASDSPAITAAGLAAVKNDPNRFDTRAWIASAMTCMSEQSMREQEPSSTLRHIAHELHVGGPACNCLTACAAGSQAIGEAADLLRRGDADVVITGGAHSVVNFIGVSGFSRLTALSTRRQDPAGACRPFSTDRDGFVLAEAAGMLILETAEHAARRNAPVLAELAGHGSSADAYRITDMPPDGRGSIAAMAAALADAAIRPDQVDYISAHGTGTRDNDAIETLAIKALFGEHARRLAVSSVKSMIGHSITAAGAVEAITCVLAIRDQMLPPTINLHNPDPACDLDYVPHRGRPARVNVCLSNSFGFGGQNESLVIRRAELSNE